MYAFIHTLKPYIWGVNGEPWGATGTSVPWWGPWLPLLEPFALIFDFELDIPWCQFTLEEGILSRMDSTSDMWGRYVASRWQHWRARFATKWASLREYGPSSFMSMILNSFFGSLNWGLTHSNHFLSLVHRLLSIASRPVMSSNNTIPKLYTSHFVGRLPVHIDDTTSYMI